MMIKKCISWKYVKMKKEKKFSVFLFLNPENYINFTLEYRERTRAQLWEAMIPALHQLTIVISYREKILFSIKLSPRNLYYLSSRKQQWNVYKYERERERKETKRKYICKIELTIPSLLLLLFVLFPSPVQARVRKFRLTFSPTLGRKKGGEEERREK